MRPARVALLHSVTSREGATTTEGSIAVDAVINWMGRTLLGLVLGVVRQADLVDIQALLGHANLATTQRFTPTSGRSGWSWDWGGCESSAFRQPIAERIYASRGRHHCLNSSGHGAVTPMALRSCLEKTLAV